MDANADTRQALCTLLESLGHQVVATGDAEAALDLVEAQRPELVICDPAVGAAGAGFDLARTLQGRGIYLLAYSGGYLPDQRGLAEDAGFHHYMSKPSTRRDFREFFAAWDAVDQQTEEP